MRRARDPRLRALQRAQAIVARYLPKGRDLVQELIDERRQEAAREECASIQNRPDVIDDCLKPNLGAR